MGNGTYQASRGEVEARQPTGRRQSPRGGFEQLDWLCDMQATALPVWQQDAIDDVPESIAGLALDQGLRNSLWLAGLEILSQCASERILLGVVV